MHWSPLSSRLSLHDVSDSVDSADNYSVQPPASIQHLFNWSHCASSADQDIPPCRPHAQLLAGGLLPQPLVLHAHSCPEAASSFKQQRNQSGTFQKLTSRARGCSSGRTEHRSHKRHYLRAALADPACTRSADLNVPLDKQQHITDDTRWGRRQGTYCSGPPGVRKC